MKNIYKAILILLIASVLGSCSMMGMMNRSEPTSEKRQRKEVDINQFSILPIDDTFYTRPQIEGDKITYNIVAQTRGLVGNKTKPLFL
ncbi:hypothetical protein P9314_03150 [Paenibacillus validus]|uniref:hypothetical protein n=1 Tax=Paenibacillus TaxID=44249 RepID=UPI0013E0703E|nr:MULTISPECIES: hypothetical protein [Paenibacillus]MED4599702.1 hypothetical protein [Paenibacillus validus]MED4604865.1 hypothetical protein [Paenibacillus validus]